MSNEKTPTAGTQQNITALQLWNAQIAELVRLHVYKGSMREDAISKSAVIPLRYLLQRTHKTIEAVQQFEVTKHRTIIDAIIAKLNESDEKLHALKKELHNNPWFLFNRKRKIKADIRSVHDYQLGCRTALLLVVNTPPPPMI